MKLGNRLSPVKPGFWKVASGPIFECNIGVVEASAEGYSSYRLSAIGFMAVMFGNEQSDMWLPNTIAKCCTNS